MPLHLEGIGHRYGAVEALAGIDLDVADGETVAILRALVKRYRTGPTTPSPAPSTPAPVRSVKPIKVKP